MISPVFEPRPQARTRTHTRAQLTWIPTLLTRLALAVMFVVVMVVAGMITRIARTGVVMVMVMVVLGCVLVVVASLCLTLKAGAHRHAGDGTPHLPLHA